MKEIPIRSAREKAGLSLREAAKKLGITHAYLSGLELGHKPLQPDRAQQLTKLYGLPSNITLMSPSPCDSQEFVTWLREQIRWWDSRFVLPMVPAVSRMISALYVDPAFLTEDGRALSARDLLGEFLVDRDNYGLLLHGDIGSGKSFFARMLTLETEAVCQSAGVKDKYIPVFVSLGEFQLKQGSLLPALSEYYVEHGLRGSALQLEVFFQKCLERGNLLLLLDGLDEIQDHRARVETLARLQQQFESEIRETGSKLIITGRHEAFYERDRSYAGFRLVQIQRWQSDQMYAASLKWPFNNEAERGRFLHVLQASDDLFMLARWPLLFHLLATLHSAAGLRTFQGLAGVCDDCCEVLENTWDSARRSFTKSPVADRRSTLLQSYPWIKWRHFLIHLMEVTLAQDPDFQEVFKLTFGSAEVKDAWESFLLAKGMERSSLEYARLEDLISDQQRIGPIFQHRRGAGGQQVEYSFLDSIFGHYYYSKAFINKAADLKSLVLQHMRDERWHDLLPLTVQELGKSERAYENRLGEELIDVMLGADDELELEHRHKIGNFGLLLAARSILAFNVDKYWERVLAPFLDSYMHSIYESDGRLQNRILGEYVACPQLREYFLSKVDDLIVDADRHDLERNDLKWRTLVALGRFGEKLDLIVEQQELDIRQVIHKGRAVDELDGIKLRRLIWGLGPLGRVFVLEEGLGKASLVQKAERIRRVIGSLRSLVEFAVTRFREELSSRTYSDVSFWDVLAVVLETAGELQYRELVIYTLREVYGTLEKRLKECFENYPHSEALLQFLKVAGRYGHLLDDGEVARFARKLEEIEADAVGQRRHELAVITTLFKNRTRLRAGSVPVNDFYQEMGGNCDLPTFKGWIDVVRRQSKSLYPDALKLGMAVWGIGHFRHMLDSSARDYSRTAVIESLLTALRVELASPEEVRNSKRLYSAPFRIWCHPLYDHIYDCIVSLSEELPLKLKPR